MTPPKMHYQCWTPSDTASDTCIHEGREEDRLCTGCARRYGSAASTRACYALETGERPAEGVAGA